MHTHPVVVPARIFMNRIGEALETGILKGDFTYYHMNHMPSRQKKGVFPCCRGTGSTGYRRK